MKIAISVWQDRISPVFDSSQWLHIYQVVEKQVDSRIENIAGIPPQARAERLQELGVDVLICGAITRQLHVELSGQGIEVLSFVCGNVDAVMNEYLTYNRIDNRFSMPGYGRRNRRGRRGAGGRGCRQ